MQVRFRNSCLPQFRLGEHHAHELAVPISHLSPSLEVRATIVIASLLATATPKQITMADAPLITFKAGRCEFHGRKVTPQADPGYIYLYTEDELLHFCWRPRSASTSDPELDLIMFPSDGHFYPLLKEQGAEDLHSPTNGRIFVLKFTSSSQKYFFWMQSKSQSREGHNSWFSQRDQRLGQIVDALLQGDDVDVQGEIEDMAGGGGGDDAGPDGDDLMDLDGGPGLERRETGGAGQNATGGDSRAEGEANREGGADGGRA